MAPLSSPSGTQPSPEEERDLAETFRSAASSSFQYRCWTCTLEKFVMNFSLTLLIVLCISGGTLASAIASSASVFPDSKTDCNTVRQRFRSASLDSILTSLFNADIVLESGDMPKANEQLQSTRQLTVTVNCFHKGYLVANQVTASLHTNFTHCIDEQTIDGVLGNDRRFVFFLRRLPNASLVLLEGGAVRASDFYNKTRPICNLRSQTKEKACSYYAGAPSNDCQDLQVFLTVSNAGKQVNREPYFQPVEPSREESSRRGRTYMAAGGSGALHSSHRPSRWLQAALVAVVIPATMLMSKPLL